MKARRTIFEVVVALLLLLPAPVKATPFTYTISFASVGGLPADTFSFSVPGIITSAQSIEMPAGTELNEFHFTTLEVSPTSASLEFWVPTRSYDWGSGDLAGLSILFDTFPTGVGTYTSTDNAIRTLMVPWVGMGFRIPTPYPADGSLTITNASAGSVPDSGSSVLLFGLSLAGLRAWRRRGQ
jgi:hypothetical protein